MEKMKVALIVGSKNDIPYLDGAKEIFENFGISYDIKILSAHRNLDETMKFAETAEEQGYRIIIACAGMAAHLPGVIAAKTILPVIGVPLPTSEIKGIDSLLSMVQMPSGVPVAAMTIGKAGIKNAAIFAASILSLQENNIKIQLNKFKESLK